ncbi:hypothetical protein WMY93_021724 [Mugilogobius chulae]|uniref:Uncharacterized protein n=1 Tax=Mugilogobius chulae TaxID=88201 RepID=A0AAW0NG53_9GOBI
MPLRTTRSRFTRLTKASSRRTFRFLSDVAVGLFQTWGTPAASARLWDIIIITTTIMERKAAETAEGTRRGQRSSWIVLRMQTCSTPRRTSRLR